MRLSFEPPRHLDFSRGGVFPQKVALAPGAAPFCREKQNLATWTIVYRARWFPPFELQLPGLAPLQGIRSLAMLQNEGLGFLAQKALYEGSHIGRDA